MTQSNDKMDARGALWSIIPRDGTRRIIRWEIKKKKNILVFIFD